MSQHFAPEVTACRFRIEAFAQGLLGRGHAVEVLCPVPNHPDGVIRPSYRGRMVTRRTLDGARVRYLWVWTSATKSVPRRLGYYGSFAALAVAAGAAARRPDVILATSPPLTIGAVGALLSKRHRVPWVLDVRDLWPQAAVDVGELKGERAIGLAESLERRLYRDATSIVAATAPFGERIVERGGDPGKVSVIMNGTTRAWTGAAGEEPDRAAEGLPEDRFVWAYAGNLGLLHGLEAAVEAARLLGEDYQLQITGQGPRREHLEQLARDLPDGRVVIRDLVPPEEAARRLRAADAVLVMQRGFLTDVISSKLFDSCGVGRPVIVAAAGEMARLVESSGAALTVAPDDAEALAAAVRRLREDRVLGARVAERGRAFAAEHLREQQAERLADVLESAAVIRERGFAT